MTVYAEKTKEQLAELLEIMESDHKKGKEDYARLKESYAKLAQENIQITESLQKEKETSARLSDQCETLKKELETARKTIEADEARFKANYELFKSFVDDDSQKILLLDTAYGIRYINRPAAEYLGLSESALSDCRIFDFFKYNDAVKIKEKIDEAFLTGEKEKVKDIKFRRPGGKSVKLKMKILRTRYDNKPSVKLLIK